MSQSRPFSASNLSTALNTLIARLPTDRYQYSESTELKEIRSDLIKHAVNTITAEYRNANEAWLNHMSQAVKEFTPTQLFNLTYYLMRYDSNNSLMLLRSSNRITNYLYQHCYQQFRTLDSHEMIALNNLVFDSMKPQSLPGTTPEKAAVNAISFSLGLGAVASTETYQLITQHFDKQQELTTPTAMIAEHKSQAIQPMATIEDAKAAMKLNQWIVSLGHIKKELVDELSQKSSFFTSSIHLKGAKIAFVHDLIVDLQALSKTKNYTNIDASIASSIERIMKKSSYQCRHITFDMILQGRLQHRTKDSLKDTLGEEQLQTLATKLRVGTAH